MDGAMATATSMDGAMVTRWQQKARWEQDGNNVVGLRIGPDGDGNGRRDGEVVAMTVMDGATATTILQWQRQWMAQQTYQSAQFGDIIS
jgi:hypothetical protein